MSKFQRLDKKILLLTLVFSLTAPSFASEKKKNKELNASHISPAVVAMIEQSKKLLNDGKRKLAFDKLAEALKLARTKADKREINSKKQIFAEQFITTEAFQTFQEAIGYRDVERWPDCVRALDAISQSDQSNVLVLKTKTQCLIKQGQFERAKTTLSEILTILPDDNQAAFQKAEIATVERKFPEGLEILKGVEAKGGLQSVAEIERFVILKSKLLALSGKTQDAIDVLREDQENYLEHVQVLYELGILYQQLTGHDWYARKYLSLFVTRCKHLSESELKERHLDASLTQAQSILVGLDKKLGV